jgi:hypothetical protein
MSEENGGFGIANPEETAALTQVLQEANPMDNPTLTVIGILNKGTDKESKLVKADWNGQTSTLTSRTLTAVEKLGITVRDEESNYVF